MSETKTLRLSKVAKEFNVGLHNIVEFLETRGQHIEINPNAKIDDFQYELLLKEFQSEKLEKEKTQHINTALTGKVSYNLDEKLKSDKYIDPEESNEEILIKDASIKEKKGDEEDSAGNQTEELKRTKSDGPEIKVVGKIELAEKKPTKKNEEDPKNKTTTKDDSSSKTLDEKTASKQLIEDPSIPITIGTQDEEKEIETIKATVKKLEGPTIFLLWPL